MRSLWKVLAAMSLVLVVGCGSEAESDGGDQPCNPNFVSDDCAQNNDDANNGDANNGDANNGDANNGDANNGDANNGEPVVTERWPGCVYPEGASRLPTGGEVMPEMSWKNAHNWDGSTFEFSLRDFYCDPNYDGIQTLVFMATAGWCPACPEHAQYLNSLYEDFRAAGALLIFMEVEDETSTPATSEQAHTLVTRYLGQFGAGLRVGDADTEPRMMFNGNFLIQAFPTTFVVRRSDMRIIATSNDSQLIFPALQVARHPEANWADRSHNTLPVSVGESCVNDGDCETGTLVPYCVTAFDGWPQGYCLAVDCADDAACGANGVCAQDSNGIGICYRGCDAEAADCRSGYSCQPLSSFGGGPSVCAPEER